jgi:dihydrolipoamide dehydrogenase
MKVDDKVIAGKMIFLATGSKATVPPIKGLEAIRYHTSDSVIRMEMKKRPKSIAIIGAGYIGAEFGHFFAAVGSQVTIIGRNPQFLPEEEPEVSALAKRELGKHMTILTNHDVIEVQQTAYGMKKLVAVERQAGAKVELEAEEILVATGRGPLNDILHPEKAGVTTTREGWIQVDEYLETTQPNVWAFGDADGKYPFRHVANYESEVVYANAVLKRKVKVDYHAIPHAVFTYPEIASVGMKESEAVQKHGKENVLIGFYRYEDTAKGEAMNVKDYFVKVIIERSSRRILGAHIIGPSASILIHEIIAAMYAPTRSAEIISDAIHIHPALSEVVQRAIGSPMPVEHYHHHFGAEIEAPR